MALEGINMIAWGTKLLLTAVLASLVDCISMCHILYTAKLLSGKTLHKTHYLLENFCGASGHGHHVLYTCTVHSK